MNKYYPVAGMLTGIGIGVTLAIGLHNLAIGLGVGTAIGCALFVTSLMKKQNR